MPYRFWFALILAICFLGTYPGTHPYFSLLAHHRIEFEESKGVEIPQITDVVVVDPVPPPVVSAEAVYIVELTSFTPVLKKNERLRLYPASTTKVLTALVARKKYHPEDVIQIETPLAIGQTMGLVAGERITMEHLLYGTLIQSGNDAAHALASAENYENFIAEMNAVAANIGMRDSVFINPTGLHDPQQVTTAFDLALLGRELLEDPYLKKIVAIKDITISDVDFQIFHTLRNVNRLLGSIRGLGGLKTGYTEQAGENLISFYRHQDREYIIVVLKSQNRFEDSTALVQWIDTAVRTVTP